MSIPSGTDTCTIHAFTGNQSSSQFSIHNRIWQSSNKWKKSCAEFDICLLCKMFVHAIFFSCWVGFLLLFDVTLIRNLGKTNFQIWKTNLKSHSISCTYMIFFGIIWCFYFHLPMRLPPSLPLSLCLFIYLFFHLSISFIRSVCVVNRTVFHISD